MIVETIHWVTQILSFTAEKRGGFLGLVVCLCSAWWTLQSKPGHKPSLYKGNNDLSRLKFAIAFRCALNDSESRRLTASCFETKNLILKQENSTELVDYTSKFLIFN